MVKTDHMNVAVERPNLRDTLSGAQALTMHGTRPVKSQLFFAILCIVAIFNSANLSAQGGPGHGRGPGFRGGHGQRGGHGRDERHDADHEVFHFLLSNHEKISRKVTQLPNGVETLTESDDPEIASKIKEHVEWMEYRVEHSQPIRMRDPLFAELFRHADKIDMKHEDTENGVRVIETSDDPYVATLIKRHAEVVSGFVEQGYAEAMKNHQIPGFSVTEKSKQEFPRIENYGSIVRLPAAAHQPRSKARIVVDVTAGGPTDSLSPAIEKLARFVNLYSSLDREPLNAQIAVVIHGDATPTVLNGDVYSAKYRTDGNPNLDCLRELHEAGVEIYVCGQSILGDGHRPEDAVVFVDVALSAVTALVNLQSDGYANVSVK